MNFLSKIMTACALITCLSYTSAWADVPRILTWNVNGGQQDKDILAQNVNDMKLDVGSFDVLVVQEVISSQQVAAIAEKIGFDHWVISDFSPPVEVTGKWFKSLEVAIISKTPFESVAEWDTTGKLPNGDPYDPRTSDTSVPTESLALGLTMKSEERPSRGFLRADFADGLSVYAVHWKSSGGASGDEDLPNAAKRENNARGVAKDASDQLGRGRSVVIAGDYNIQPIGKHIRVGSDVSEDCTPSLGNCGAGGLDGYDDSVKIVSDIDSSFRLLSEELPPTYLRGNFGPGAIDHIAVAGPLAASYSLATTASVSQDSYFGSDHSPVFAGVASPGGSDVMRSTGLATSAASARNAKIQRLMKEVRDRLDAIDALMVS
ncbi:MAG: endonuclease/exonuclease/phosphatase family protein, partial [Pseudomonadota bacterium]